SLTPRIDKCRDTILHVLLRFQDAVLIIAKKLLKLRVLHAHIIGNLPVVQNVPLYRGADAIVQAAAREDVAEAAGTHVSGQSTDVADKTEGWKQIGFCHSDLRGLSRGLELRAPDIGSAPQQVCGNADDHLLRSGGDVGRAGE